LFDGRGRGLIKRVTIALGVALLLAVVLVVGPLLALFLQVGWDGARATRSLAAGQSVTLDSGLTLTVPPQYRGVYARYYDLPSWLMLGENFKGMHRSEDLQLVPLHPSGSTMHITARSYAQGGPPTTGYDLLVSGRDVSVLVSTISIAPRQSLQVVTHVPGRPVGYVFLSAPSGEPRADLSRGWALANIQGVALP
jgi:hypothetical protein